MSRDEGFAIADISTSKLDDAKVKAMWRALRDEGAMNAACVLYEAVQLASWRHGERMTAEDAAPVWMADVEAPASALVQHGLLDSERRIPRRAFNAWFGAAAKRRRVIRERWRRAKTPREMSTAIPSDSAPTPRGTSDEPANPSVRPSDRPSVRPARARRARGTGLTPIGGNGVDRDRASAIARARAKLEDPDVSEDVKVAARFALERLGVSA